MSETHIICRKIQTPEEREEAFAIRRTVFIDGQSVPEDIEYDEFDLRDDDTVVHFIGLADGFPAAAGRLSIFDDCLKVERIAVLDEFRGSGLGKEMVLAILEECGRYPEKKVMGHAQFWTKEFYESLGWKAVGDVFEEAGIMHIKMVYESQ